MILSDFWQKGRTTEKQVAWPALSPDTNTSQLSLITAAMWWDMEAMLAQWYQGP